MSEPRDELAAPEARLAQADQALLLARVIGSVVALACFAIGEGAVLGIGRYEARFAHSGVDAELHLITRLVFSGRTVLLFGLPVLFGITLFFIWARGKAAAWMAGVGLLLMILCAPLACWAVMSPMLTTTEKLQK